MVASAQGGGADGGRPLDASEAGVVARCARLLGEVPVGGSLSHVLDAIRPAVPPVGAGLLITVRPEAPAATVSCPVRLDAPVLERWLGTPAELLAPTLAPILAARPGALRRDSETVGGALRERMDVFHALDVAGLGEGAGYKAAEQRSRIYGAEHVVFAMLMERRAPVPERAEALLAALHPALSGAILRTTLPFSSCERLGPQIAAAPERGYLCVSRSGQVLEANGAAHHLVARFLETLRVPAGKSALADFAARAPGLAGKAWTARREGTGPRSLLHVRTHELGRATQSHHEEVYLMEMEEIPVPPSRADEVIELCGLTPREREIALYLAHTSLAHKEIAARLGISPRTVDTHVDSIEEKLEKLGVRGRLELMVLAAT